MGKYANEFFWIVGSLQSVALEVCSNLEDL